MVETARGTPRREWLPNASSTGEAGCGVRPAGRAVADSRAVGARAPRAPVLLALRPGARQRRRADDALAFDFAGELVLDRRSADLGCEAEPDILPAQLRVLQF